MSKEKQTGFPAIEAIRDMLPMPALGPQLVYATGGFGDGSGDEPKRTVRGQRRRQTQSQPGERPRAEAGHRDDSPGGGGLPPLSGGGSGGSSGGSSGGGYRPSGGGLPIPGGGGCGGIGLGGIVVILLIGYFLWTSFSGGGGAVDQGTTPQQQEAPLPQIQQETGGFQQGSVQGSVQGSLPVMATPRPPQLTTRPTAAAVQQGAAGANTAGGDTWTVMLYQDADDKVLEQDIYIDLNEAERIGSNDKVQIVAQIDRYRGGYQADGDWTSAKRFHVTRDDDLTRVGSRAVQDLGEVNMADPQTLVDFVTWAVQNYPADKYVLILSDHGMGWPGGWSDPTAQTAADRRFPLSQALGTDMLYLQEIDAALGTIRQRTGIDKFELIGMDACLMGHVEVFSMLEPHARYAVASQETEPSLGWAYTAFLSALQRNPSMTGGDLGQLIVSSYIDDDQRIVDENARMDFVSGGRPMSGLFASAPAADSVARQLSQSITLTAADLSKMAELNRRLNDFAYAMQQVNQRAVGQARSYAQNFTSVFGGNVPPSYIDLGHFALLVAQATQDQGIANVVQPLVSAIDGVVVAEKNGPSKPGATGISVYFPNSQLYQSAAAGPASYNVAAARFVEQSLWDEFLAFYYTGNGFQADSRSIAAPAAGVAMRSLAAGGITLSPVTLSSEVAAEGQPVLMSADVGGENIGYIKLLVGYIDQQNSAIQWIDTDYIEAPKTRELNGVFYPDWGEGDFTLEFEWEPYVTAVTDGQTNAVALFSPESFGNIATEAIYSVDGLYTYGDGEERYARAYFRDGVLQQVFGYTNADFTGSPREITPETGDKFTVFEQWMDLDSSGNITGSATEPGKTVTFGNDTLRWTELVAAAGDYIVGFVVEDLDGNQKASYARVTVQ